MRLALVTDAWLPQVNGVVRTLSNTVREIEAAGHEVHVISPADFRTIPCPTYPEIRLSLFAGRARSRRMLDDARPPTPCTSRPKDRSGSPRAAGACVAAGRSRPRITRSSRNTSARARPIPLSVGYAAVRWFHGARHARWWRPRRCSACSSRTASATSHSGVAAWTRSSSGRARSRSSTLPRPIWLYFGRVAVEKGIEDFLSPRPARYEARGGRRTRRRTTETASSARPCSPATGTARSWRPTSRPRTSSCFRAAPTRSAWCCSRPWPAACRWRRTP